MAPAKRQNTTNTVTPQKLDNVFKGVVGQGKWTADLGEGRIPLAEYSFPT